VDAYNGHVAVYGQMTGDAWNKIYYSTNNGTNWGLITATNYAFGNCDALALDPHRLGRIFIGTGERSVGIFTPGTPEQQWQLDYFGSTNSSQGANGADPSGNAVPNIVAYALGADPLAGLTNDPMAGFSTNARTFLPQLTRSTNPLLAGREVMQLFLPDPPPSDTTVQVVSSTNLVNWVTNASRVGTNAWQWLAGGSSQIALDVDTNGRAIYEIGTELPGETNQEFLQFQVIQSAP